MKIVYALEEIPYSFTKSLFLAGCSPRSNTPPGYNWRPEALTILEELGYDGVVFVPLPRDGKWHGNYDGQVQWEQSAMNHSDVIMFWVPRDMEYLPGLTTNFEFGQRIAGGNVVLGYPENAEKMSYLQWMAEHYSLPKVSFSLKETLQIAINKIGNGFPRDGGECQIPIHIWKTNHFQNWYLAHVKAGNRLDGSRLIFNHMVGPNKDIPMFIGLHVNVWIRSEDRHKDSEIIFMRPDIMTIVAVKKHPDLMKSELLLVKEFRSPVVNEECMVYENPGGSSLKKDITPKVLAAKELEEETGLQIDIKRFVALEARQLASTALTHKAHLFVVELTDEELKWCKEQQSKNQFFGISDDTEKTYLTIMSVEDTIKSRLLDWSNLGMIFSALHY